MISNLLYTLFCSVACLFSELKFIGILQEAFIYFALEVTP